MTDFAPYDLLVDRDDVVAYLEAAGIAARLAPTPADIAVEEVTAGNMNRVFLARGPLGSVAVKQAPPWVQAVGPEWPVDPARIATEARAYELLASLVPASVPVIERIDLDRFVMVMEDLSDLPVLRDALVQQVTDVAAGRTPIAIDFTSLGTVVGRFVAELSLATSEVGLAPAERAELITAAANPELCEITYAAVLEEPYKEHDHNHWVPELDEAVRSMYTDSALLAGVASVTDIFANRAEALIHGDLHSGSLMVGTRDGAQAAKVFDPEFSFVGPIGMDLGIFWANMVIAGIAADAVGAHELADARRSAVAASWAEFTVALAERWPTRVGAPDGLDLDAWLARIEGDAWAFAGVEGVRRTAGFSHAADILSLPAHLVGGVYAEVLQRARDWVITRADAAGTTRGAGAAASSLVSSSSTDISTSSSTEGTAR